MWILQSYPSGITFFFFLKASLHFSQHTKNAWFEQPSTMEAWYDGFFLQLESENDVSLNTTMHKEIYYHEMN